MGDSSLTAAWRRLRETTASRYGANGLNFNFRSLRADVFGGLIAAVVSLPLALAYGEASSLGAVAGLYGAVCLCLMAAVFGGTRTMISGPIAPNAVAVAIVISQYAQSFSETVTIIVMAGAIQLLLGALKVGRFVSYTPYSVISGFMSGIGVIIMVLQIRPFLGLPVGSNGVVETILSWQDAVAGVNLSALAVASVTLAIGLAWPRRLQEVLPSAVGALLVGTALGALWLRDIPVIGEVPTGMPQLHMPDLAFDTLLHAVQPSATIALIGSIDILLTALIVQSMTHQRYDPDRDLLGQGIGHIAAGILGGCPGGASIGTIANIRAGARSRVSGAFCAMVLLALVLGLGSHVSLVPHAVLAGILMKVGWDFIDWRFVTRIHRVQREHLVIMVTTLALTVFLDLITAIALGLVIAALGSARQFERLELDSIISTPLLDRQFLGASDEARAALDDPFAARAVLVALRGSFTVASSQKLINTIGEDIKDHEIVILDFSDTTHIDDSAALVVEFLVEAAAAQGTETVVMGLTDPVAEGLHALDVLQPVPEDHFVETLDEARDLTIRLLSA